MPHKVTWTKGMRLSTDVFNAMDAAAAHSLNLVARLAAEGRYGLFPAAKPFELSAGISSNCIDVVSLNCHGITRSGKIIDIDFDSNYSHTFDTRVAIPAGADEQQSFLLVVRMLDGKWREIDGVYSEAAYVFELVGENSPLDDDSLPVASIVNQYGWRLNETDFVPPCLYVTAHHRFAEQAARGARQAKSILARCLTADGCPAGNFISALATAASYAWHRLEKEADTLTPAQMLATIQHLVTTFIVACTADQYVNLSSREQFDAYAMRPPDMRRIFADVEDGLALLGEMSVLTDAVCAIRDIPEPAPAPKPKPAPRPAPEPDVKRRRGWEGIEI